MADFEHMTPFNLVLKKKKEKKSIIHEIAAPCSIQFGQLEL